MMMIVLLNFDFLTCFGAVFLLKLVVVVDVDGAVSIDIGDCKFKLYS